MSSTRPRGRPPKANKTATKNLGGVRLTDDLYDELSKAAALEGMSLAEWIRGVTTKAAARVMRKHGK